MSAEPRTTRRLLAALLVAATLDPEALDVLDRATLPQDESDVLSALVAADDTMLYGAGPARWTGPGWSDMTGTTYAVVVAETVGAWTVASILLALGPLPVDMLVDRLRQELAATHLRRRLVAAAQSLDAGRSPDLILAELVAAS